MYNAIQNTNTIQCNTKIKIIRKETQPLANFLTIPIQLYKSKSSVITTKQRDIHFEYKQTTNHSNTAIQLITITGKDKAHTIGRTKITLPGAYNWQHSAYKIQAGLTPYKQNTSSAVENTHSSRKLG